MELTTKGRYAVMAMADLALHSGGVWADNRVDNRTDHRADAGAQSAAVQLADLAQDLQTTPQTTSQAVPLSAISERQEISLAYLEQIFGALRRGGLVTSLRGRTGGYQLARPPRNISICAIMAAVDEGMAMIRCDGERDGGCVGEARCQTHELWTALGLNIASFLANVSLKDLLDGVSAGDICNAHSIAECARFSARHTRSAAAAPGGANQTSTGVALTAAEWTIK